MTAAERRARLVEQLAAELAARERISRAAARAEVRRRLRLGDG